jgi:hypothetical protein
LYSIFAVGTNAALMYRPRAPGRAACVASTRGEPDLWELYGSPDGTGKRCLETWRSKVTKCAKLPRHHVAADMEHIHGHRLGFEILISDWARRQPSAVRGIVYFETQVRPRSWDEFGPAQRGLFERLRSPEGEEMVLQQNVFVETLLPLWIIRPLSDEEMAVYRRPFLISGEDRRPMLTFPREILIGGEPQHMLGVVGDYAHWMEIE